MITTARFASLIAAPLALCASALLASPHTPAAKGKSPAEHVGEKAPAHAAGQAHAAGPVHWTYSGATGPDSWGDLADGFSQCKTGHMQSPIDLGASDIQGQINVRTAYRPGAMSVLNNGHTIQVNFPEGSILSSGISRYKLVQVHFHTPSEETIYGVPYPMVAHFVHADHAGNLAVLGVLFEEGAHNPELDKIIKAAPRSEAAARLVAGVTLDPARLLPSELAVWRYDGSLTTPPCSEGVRWHVAMQPVAASAAQIAAIHAIIGDNARPIQPRHGRLLVGGTGGQ